ncbi:MAG: hypothetical protein KGJ86_17000 [Chloroflexota bacterium]|nr:hypothetical protein [Chloroflexota bacterium]
MSAADRWQKVFGRNHGVFVDVTNSQRIVEHPDQAQEFFAETANKLTPEPYPICVKFGGDWGGMWGDPERWAQLRQTDWRVVPYLFCEPAYADRYPLLVGDLVGLGYPAVVLDVEEDWDGHGDKLAAMLDQLNLADNLIGVSGYAWFGAFSAPLNFVGALHGKDLVYLPQAYLGQLTAAADPLAYMQVQLGSEPFQGLPMAYTLDASSLVQRYVTAAPIARALPWWAWHLTDVDPEMWSAACANDPPVEIDQDEPGVLETPAEEAAEGDSPAVANLPAPGTPAALSEAATNLGQSLVWLQQLDTIATELKGTGLMGGVITADEFFPHIQQLGVQAGNLVADVTGAQHAARKLIGGE